MLIVYVTLKLDQFSVIAARACIKEVEVATDQEHWARKCKQRLILDFYMRPFLDMNKSVVFYCTPCSSFHGHIRRSKSHLL